MEVNDLKAYFEKYPKSNKRIIRICNNCEDKRNIPFAGHSDLCNDCSNRIPEKFKAFRTPEVIEARRLRSIEYWSDQTNRDAMSEIIKNSETAKVAVEKRRGGNDICEHHYIYDHANPELYTTKMTRSKHAQIHAWMRKAGIIVPHINVTEE